MLSSKVKDLKSRQLFYKAETLKRVNKFLWVNSLNSSKNDFSKLSYVCSKKKLIDSRNSKVEITRRCALNNRGRGVLRPFGISRVYLRELLLFGSVPGYSKAVW